MRQLVHLLAVDVLVQKLNLTKKTSQLIIKTIKFNKNDQLMKKILVRMSRYVSTSTRCLGESPFFCLLYIQ